MERVTLDEETLALGREVDTYLERLLYGIPPSDIVLDLTDIKPATVNNAIGLERLTQGYGENPEILAQNAGLALYLTLEQTERMLDGDSDTDLLEVPSQTLQDDLIAAMATDERRRAGFAALSHELSRIHGYSSMESLNHHLALFQEERLDLFKNQGAFSTNELNARKEALRADIAGLKYGLRRIIGNAIDQSQDGLSAGFDQGMLVKLGELLSEEIPEEDPKALEKAGWNLQSYRCINAAFWALQISGAVIEPVDA